MPIGGKREGAGRKKGVPNKVSAELKELARPYAPEALATLCKIMRTSKQDAARVAAAKELLDRGFGKAPQAISGPDGGAIEVKDITAEEAAKRIAFLLTQALESNSD